MIAETSGYAEILARLPEDDRAREIANLKRMIALTATPDELLDAPVRDLGEYLDTEMELPPELVSGYIVVPGGITATVGRAGKGKTVMSLNRILRWAAGKPMFDVIPNVMAPERPLRILIVENEGAAPLFRQRIGWMLTRGGGNLSSEDVRLIRENVLIWGDGGYSGLKLDEETGEARVRRGIEQHRPDAVLFEPFRGLWSGEENSATDMEKVIDVFKRLSAEYELGVLVTHHESKAGRGEDGEGMNAARGSTALEGGVAVFENFEKAKGNDQRELSWAKNRYAQPPLPMRMTWDPETWWYNYIPPEAGVDEVIAVLRAQPEGTEMYMAELMSITGEKRSVLDKALRQLIDEEKVKRTPTRQLPNGGGSTGPGYRLVTSENDIQGGLGV